MEYWQAFLPPRQGGAPERWDTFYDAVMPDGSRLRLPLRDRGKLAVAGMIANQAGFAVIDRMSAWMTELAHGFAAEVVVGLPTLGHVYAAAVARGLGHRNWVAPGTSRKVWYDAALSVPLVSSTAPEAGRSLWLDPRLLTRLAGRRALLVDDVISTGSSAHAGLRLLELAGVRPVGLCVAMAQGDRWCEAWPADVPVAAVFATPVFARAEPGWTARTETVARDMCRLAVAAPGC